MSLVDDTRAFTPMFRRKDVSRYLCSQLGDLGYYCWERDKVVHFRKGRFPATYSTATAVSTSQSPMGVTSQWAMSGEVEHIYRIRTLTPLGTLKTTYILERADVLPRPATGDYSDYDWGELLRAHDPYELVKRFQLTNIITGG